MHWHKEIGQRKSKIYVDFLWRRRNARNGRERGNIDKKRVDRTRARVERVQPAYKKRGLMG